MQILLLARPGGSAAAKSRDKERRNAGSFRGEMSLMLAVAVRAQAFGDGVTGAMRPARPVEGRGTGPGSG